MTIAKFHLDGQLFGPNASGKRYLSVNYHRSPGGTKEGKSIWHPDVSRDMEYTIFCTADSEKWEEAKHYWGLHNRAETQLGTDGEIICKFPCPSNLQDPWHGYPLHTSKSKDRPSDSFVRTCWLEKGIVSKGTARKIVKGYA
jgi:hypothetical protein